MIIVKESKIEWYWMFVTHNIEMWQVVMKESIVSVPMELENIFVDLWINKFTAYDKENPEFFIYLQGVSRYINHSDSPNCKLQFMNSEVYVISIKNIPVWNEITIDYCNM